MTSSGARARGTGATGTSGGTGASRSLACGAGGGGAAADGSSKSSRRRSSSGSGTPEAASPTTNHHRSTRRRLNNNNNTTKPTSSLLAFAAATTAFVLTLAHAPQRALAIPPDYDPLAQNRTCTYTARGVKASLFFKGGPTAGQVRDLVDAEPNGAAARAATATSADSSSGGVEDWAPLFPLDKGAAAFSQPQKGSNSSARVTAATACFGPGETYDAALVMSGAKHSCRWRWSPSSKSSPPSSTSSSSFSADGNPPPEDALVDFEEEQACLPVLTSNCYCYSVGRSVGSYCDPGLAGTGEGVSFPIDDCAPVVKGVVADGGRPVASAEIKEVQAGTRRPPTKGHYIGLAVMPSWEDKYNTGGDFHFWRMDSSLSWSYKAGDTFVRHTLFPGMGPPSEAENESNNNATLSSSQQSSSSSSPRNKSSARNSGFGLVNAAPALKDLEEPSSRGPYTKFCGYFHVDPKTHKLGTGSGYSYSDVPVKYALWQSATAGGLLGPEASVSVLPRDAGPSEGWLGQYRKDYVDLGWCDEAEKVGGGGGDGKGAARESGSRGGNGGNGASPYEVGDVKRTRSAIPASARESGRRRGLVARPAM